MKLFEDTLLFDAGHPQHTDFALPGTELSLWEHFFTKPEADRYYDTLLAASPWQQRLRRMYDRMVPDPRMTAYYGGEKGHAWTPTLLEIKARVEAASGIAFNRVLLNLYRDGNDSVAWHSDTLPSDGVHHPIASVTFGDTRLFKVRHKTDKTVSQVSIPLRHGSFLLMGASMQDLYEHHVPKTSRMVTPRINLTFRIAETQRSLTAYP